MLSTIYKPQMSKHRVKVSIDDSWLETYHSDDVDDVIVFIHGILGDYEESWGSTPEQLKGERELANFDFASFGYGTSMLDHRNPKEVVTQFNLYLRTHMSRYRRIFIVAHSMGGLITRFASGMLVRSKFADDLQLYSKIKYCFLVAVPISGSWAARLLSAIPGLKYANHKLPFLARPQIDGEDIAQFSRQSILLAKSLGVARPRFAHFVGAQDPIVCTPIDDDLTEDDRFEGPLVGSHDTIKMDKTANSTLIRRICQCIAEDGASAPVASRGHSPPNRPKARLAVSKITVRAGTVTQRTVRDVVLLPCCATKDSNKGDLYPQTKGITHGIADANLANDIVETRKNIKSLMHSGLLDGSEFMEGNRGLRAPNREIYLGPDFGGMLNEPRFLPAYRRYLGRCYQSSPEEWKRFYSSPESQRPDVLIVSGLYGLYPADEYIQNYDLHMTDVNATNGRHLQDIWDRVVTDILLSRLDWNEERGYVCGRIFNLLTEDTYYSLFDWERINRRCTVMHQIFDQRQGREALDNVGIWMRKIVRSPEILQNIEPYRVYDDDQFVNADRMAFVTQLADVSHFKFEPDFQSFPPT
jgi:hypothetical protein